MDIPEELFQININQLIGKLHLAGQQQIPNTVVINTGVINPTASPDPANPGDTKFSTSSKTGEYQVAFAKKFIYKPEIDVTVNPKYIEAEELKKKQDEEKDKAGITDKQKDKDEKDKEELAKKYIEVFKEYKLSGFKEDPKDFDATRKSFQEALKEENEKRKTENEKKSAQLKSEIVADVEKYFESFAGKDSATSSKSDAESSDLIDLDDNGELSDPTKFNYGKYVKDFQFDLEAIAKDVEAAKEKNKTKNADEVAKTIAIILKFEVNAD